MLGRSSVRGLNRRPREEVLKGIEAAKKSRTFAQNFRGYIEKKGDSVDDLIAKIKEILR